MCSDVLTIIYNLGILGLERRQKNRNCQAREWALFAHKPGGPLLTALTLDSDLT